MYFGGYSKFYNIDEQILRRFSGHILFSEPSTESREQLFRYYIAKFGHDADELDLATFSHLTDGVVASKIEEIVSKASYKSDLNGKLTNKI